MKGLDIYKYQFDWLIILKINYIFKFKIKSMIIQENHVSIFSTSIR